MDSNDQSNVLMKESCWTTQYSKVGISDDFVYPPGYRFCPHDEELILHYLKKKVLNEFLPYNIIKDVNLYKHTPQELAENYSVLGEKQWYFFTPRSRKYPNGDRPNRAAGTGYWKATGADKVIKHNNVKVGYRKALDFYEGKPPKGYKTNWIMHEFRVNESRRLKTHASDMRLDDWVLCRIYKKADKLPSKGPGRKNELEQENPINVENLPCEKTVDSCGELARQDYTHDPNIINDYNVYYGEKSNYGVNFQSSIPLGNMDHNLSCQPNNIWPLNLDWIYGKTGEMESEDVLGFVENPFIDQN